MLNCNTKENKFAGRDARKKKSISGRREVRLMGERSEPIVRLQDVSMASKSFTKIWRFATI
jgi:hypothetical protein